MLSSGQVEGFTPEGSNIGIDIQIADVKKGIGFGEEDARQETR